MWFRRQVSVGSHEFVIAARRRTGGESRERGRERERRQRACAAHVDFYLIPLSIKMDVQKRLIVGNFIASTGRQTQTVRERGRRERRGGQRGGGRRTTATMTNLSRDVVVLIHIELRVNRSGGGDPGVDQLRELETNPPSKHARV